MRESVESFCAEAGADPLLVQGAGGNVSWKDGVVLWVKASGTWLAHAKNRNIFVPVDLTHAKSEITRGNFEFEPRVLDDPRAGPSGGTRAKPSIETLLHALMPHAVVAHLHAVEPLSFLVRKGCGDEVGKTVGNAFPYVFVDYHKPGAELARAVFHRIHDSGRDRVDIVFMKNHGIVIGGGDAAECQARVEKVRGVFRVPVVPDVPIPRQEGSIALSGVEHWLVDSQDIQQLVFNERLFERLPKDWALYPDHVVFLGNRACVCRRSGKAPDNSRKVVFVEGAGVFVKNRLSPSEVVQLQCYRQVLSRQGCGTELDPLSPERVRELLDWDAEKHRLGVSP